MANYGQIIHIHSSMFLRFDSRRTIQRPSALMLTFHEELAHIHVIKCQIVL